MMHDAGVFLFMAVKRVVVWDNHSTMQVRAQAGSGDLQFASTARRRRLFAIPG